MIWERGSGLSQCPPQYSSNDCRKFAENRIWLAKYIAFQRETNWGSWIHHDESLAEH
jgi:hypothetical protein